MTKKEAIEKIRAAADRVAKSVDYSGAVVKSLDTAVMMLSNLKAEILQGDDMPMDMYTTLGGIWKIVDSICCGYPMIPALPDVEKAAVKKVSSADFLEHAASELETALTEKADGAARVAAVKMSLAAWEGAADESAEVPVIEPGRVVELVKGAVVAKAAAAVASPAPAPSAGERIDKVAKSASVETETAPVATAAVVERVSFGVDFNDVCKAKPKAAAGAKA